MTTSNDSKKLNVAGLSVTYWPRSASVYVEALDDSGKLVLSVEWTTDGAGEVTTDEVSDETSDAVFSAVMAAYHAGSGKN